MNNLSKKQYPSNQYLTGIVSEIRLAEMVSIEAVRAMARELLAYREAAEKPSFSVQFKDGWPVPELVGLTIGAPLLHDGLHDFYTVPQLPAAPELVPVPDEFLSSEQNESGMFELSEDCMTRLAVALSQQSKGIVIPVGKALVPIEPTDEMRDAWFFMEDFDSEWEAILAAAPKPTSET